MKIINIFIDESGDPDFRPQASDYLILGSTTIVDDPCSLYDSLSELKHRLNTGGNNIARFHASEDRQEVRDQVFSVLSNKQSICENDFVVVEKRKVNPSIRDIKELYPKIAYYLLQYIFNRHNDVDKVIIYTDTLPSGKKEAIEKSLKVNIRGLLGRNEFHIYHHTSYSNFGLQAIDYYLWAVFRRWERSDLRSYQYISQSIKSEFDVFRKGASFYY